MDRENDIFIKIDNIISFIKKEVITNNKDGVIIGNSGGIDSAVTILLCKRALRDKKTITVWMPNEFINSDEDKKHAANLAKKFNFDLKTVPIQTILHQYAKEIPIALTKENIGNLSARIRANILYAIAFAENLLVVGTSDKSELEIGFYTKYGDGACDIMPIVGLYKTEVREVAKILGVPEEIINKPSSPNLWPGQTAEKEIGISYEKIDDILKGIDQSIVWQLHMKNQHKREMPKHP